MTLFEKSQTAVLFRYWMRHEKGRAFLRHTIQDSLLVSTIFFATTVLININSIFASLMQSMGNPQSPSLQIDPSKIDWSQASASSIFSLSAINQGVSLALVQQIDTGMFYASIIIISYFIIKEAWTSFNRTKLTFNFLRPAIRGVLHHNCSSRAVMKFVFLSSTVQAIASYFAGVALTVFVIVPLLESLLSDTFFTFLVSSVPEISYLIVIVPVAITFLLNTVYFKRKVGVLSS